MNTPYNLERTQDGCLWLVSTDTRTRVRPSRCFPWSEPYRCVSLRDDDGEERVFIHRTEDLDAGSALVLREALDEAGFVLEIERIESVEEEFQLRTWKVVTRQGPRSFQTREEDWPTRAPGGGLLIRDLAGDVFHLARPAALDPRSRRILWPYID